MNLLSDISEFYNQKFLLNACSAAINPELKKEAYEACLRVIVIINANNTNNLLKLIEIYVNNIKKNMKLIII